MSHQTRQRTLHFGPDFRFGVDNLEVSCFGNLQQPDLFILLELLLRVVAAHLCGNNVVISSVNQELLAMYVQLGGRGLVIVVGNALWITPQEFHDGVIAQMQVPRPTQVHDSGERDYPAHGVVMCRERQRELSSGRMSENDDALGIDGIFACQLAQKLVSRSYVFKAARPSSTGIPDTAVLEVPGNEAGLRECRAEKARMLEIIAGTPKAPMDEHCSSEWARAFRHPEIAELILIVAVA